MRREEGRVEGSRRERGKEDLSIPSSSLDTGIGFSNALRYSAHTELRRAHFLGSFPGLCDRRFCVSLILAAASGTFLKRLLFASLSSSSISQFHCLKHGCTRERYSRKDLEQWVRCRLSLEHSLEQHRHPALDWEVLH